MDSSGLEDGQLLKARKGTTTRAKSTAGKHWDTETSGPVMSATYFEKTHDTLTQ
jgi:hypothetical protein